MATRFVGDVGGKFKVRLKDDGDKTVAVLLWGDHVRVLANANGKARVAARGVEGWLDESVLTDEGLLELYVIDVGQGDGLLMRTPDDAWHLIDAGIANREQMTRKGATNFLRWKFLDDLGKPKVELKSVIVTHPDFDHYGGLLDLFTGKVARPDRTFPVTVECFYHSGMGRFKDEPKLGQVVATQAVGLPRADYGIRPQGSFITELLEGKTSFSAPTRPFDLEFQELAALVGTVPGRVKRLSAADKFLPGYGPGAGPVTINVLGPVAEDLGNGPGLRVLGSESETTNGHSVVLRVDYGTVRILLTGDLNTVSQRLLLSYHDLSQFAVDVAKGCHHGSDDVDLRFVRAVKARVTVVSSGDNEDYAHPRPRILGASARYGSESRSVDGELLPPLLYSTELARSVSLAYVLAVRKTGDVASKINAVDGEVKADVTKAQFVPLTLAPISTDLVYGLINVRTDGERILCGYMKERGGDFEIRVLRGGVEP
ncbi:MAG: MBL fold metallo-hydrolase [Thermoanaerobaculaceae bacterium]|jgi:beta-lactamase superfamily II metal-dependent hydrolase|nr:MBL fold metallo-hydrolase [Thermoanaerobaculaceae bacterium]